MKKTLVFLLLIIFVVGQPSDDKLKERRAERREEMRKRRREHDKQLIDCIVRNQTTSGELLKIINDNKEGDDTMKTIYSKHNDLEKNDRDIIRDCRRKIFEKNKEEHRKERERNRERMKHHHNVDNL